MSQENVEIVRRLYEAYSQRDSETVYSLYDPEIEIDASGSGWGQVLGGRVYHGHDGLRDFMRERNDAWADITNELHELVDAGDDVISVETLRGRGRRSGVTVEMVAAGIWTIHDGRVTRVVWLGSREEALAAAGVME